MDSKLKKAILYQDMAAFYAHYAMHQMLTAHERPDHWESESFLRHAVANQRNASFYSALARQYMGIE